MMLSTSLPFSWFAREVKGEDLRSSAHKCAWVRTPQPALFLFFSWAHGPIPALLTFILDFGGLPDAGLLELGLMVQPQYLRWSIEIGP